MTSRRQFIGGALALAASSPDTVRANTRRTPPGVTGYILMDAESGAVIDSREADTAFIPASTTKAVTALVTLSTLAPTTRFFTRIHGTGPLSEGVLDGDLILVGGGDAALDTGDLAQLAAALRAKGLRRITGKFLVTGIQGPKQAVLNTQQPLQASYNPAIGPLCLNFNRVLLRWRNRGGRRILTTHAHASDRSVPAEAVHFRALKTGGALHGLEEKREVWALPARDMRRDGERWFPVRRPALYAATVLQTLCKAEGVTLPDPIMTAQVPTDPPLAMHRSDVVFGQIKKMMRYSTNLSAEMLGIAAARQIGDTPETVEDAARTTIDWLKSEGIVEGDLRLENHSGLSTRSRITPHQMADILRAGHQRFGSGYIGLHTAGRLRGDRAGLPAYDFRSKTGTMNFVRCLSGFLEVDGRRAVFAIFNMDGERRDALDAQYTPYDERKPPGSGRWLRQALDHENALLRGWVARRLS